MKRLVLWLPLALFVAFVATVTFRLYTPADPTVRSQLVGKPLPDFALPPILPGRAGVSSTDYRGGKPRLINIFGSWCIPCRVEAPQLAAIAQRGVPIDAFAIRDRPGDVAKFLQEGGDPFRNIGDDKNRAVQLALGSSGVPETFIVDGQGVIVYQHIGEIRPEHVAGILEAFERAK